MIREVPAGTMKSILMLALTLVLFASMAHPQELRQTLRLEWPEKDLSDRLMTGAHRFVERKIAETPAKRGALGARLLVPRGVCEVRDAQSHFAEDDPRRGR